MTTDTRILDLSRRIAQEFNRVKGTTSVSSRMYPFHLALANQSTAPCNIVVLGDSVLEGTATSSFWGRAQGVLEQSLRHRPGGMGYAPAWMLSSFVPNPATFSVTPVDTPTNSTNIGVQYDTVVTSRGFGAKKIGVQKNGWAEWTFSGTRVRLWYTRTTFFGLSANVSIDGTVVANLSGGDADESSRSWLSAVLPAGNHTIRVQEANGNGGSFWIEGLQFLDGDDASGVHVFDATRGGAHAADYANASSQWPESVDAVKPALILMMFGFNDSGSTTPADFKANLQTIVDRVSAKLALGTYTIAFAAPWSPDPQPSAGWSAYMAAAEEVVDAHPYGVCIRIIDRWAKMTEGQENPGMFATDTVHPTTTGQRLLGSYLASSLALPIPMR